jgi:hypothetical protein
MADDINVFRRASQTMNSQDLKKFRKSYALGFQRDVVNRVETVRNIIHTPEMDRTYNLIDEIYQELRDGVMDIEHIIRKVKYKRHRTIYGE